MPRRPLRILIGAIAVLLAVLALSGVVAAGLSAKDYGTLAFWGTPGRIDYCGRRYLRSPGSVHGTPQHFVSLDRGAPTRWHRVGRTFALRPIYATVLVHPVRGSLCAGDLYVPIGGNSNYAAYELSGGP